MENEKKGVDSMVRHIIADDEDMIFQFDQADMYLIHCFDPRPYWRKVWEIFCLANPDILVARIPLQGGSSAQPKHFLKLFEAKKANPTALVVVATHWPCGWYADQAPDVPSRDGLEVAKAFDNVGFSTVHLHVALDLASGNSVCSFTNPSKLAIQHSMISPIITNGFYQIGQLSLEEYGMAMAPGFTLNISDEFWGPPDESLCVQRRYVTDRTLELAEKLNGGVVPAIERRSRQYIVIP
ncbi:MAG: hypothetical protein NTW50_04555 [Candidatus Berkelbacteria bacterium]|nr:hypothetical protein [Candidatus Berkelbacteria bacterium]